MLNPRRKMLKFDVEDRGLHVVEERGVAVVVVLARLTVFAVITEERRHARYARRQQR